MLSSDPDSGLLSDWRDIGAENLKKKKEDKNPSKEEDIFPKIAIAECKWFANNVESDAMMQVQIDRWFADTRKVKV